MFQTKVVEKIKTHILCSVSWVPQNRAVYEIMWKIIVEPAAGHKCQYGAEKYVVYPVGYLEIRMQTHTHDIYHLLLRN